ncbi:MAG: cupredoxin domain-containing protein [Microthrixaceae bacterium]
MSQRARQRRDRAIRGRDRRRRIAAVVVVGALVLGAGALLASALGSDDDSNDGADSGKVRVSMTEFAFAPDPIVVPKGRADAIEVVNDGTVNHNLLIPQLGKGAPDLAPGKRFVLDLSGQPAGAYRVVCDLPGHTEAGMVTEITLR